MKPTTASQPLPPRSAAEDLLFILSKWKWSIVTIVVVTMLFSGGWIFLISEPSYTTEAKLLVKGGLDQPPPASGSDRQQATVGYRSAEVKSEVDILESSDLLNILIDKYKLDQATPETPPTGLFKLIRFRVKAMVRAVRDEIDDLYILAGLRERLTPREKTLEGLRKGLDVTAVEGSNSIVADLTLPVRTGSGAILNALIDEYMKFRVAIYRNSGDEYLRRAMDQRSTQLTQAEGAKNGFERAQNITSEPQEKTLLLQQLTDLEEARHEAETENKVAEAKFEQLGRETAKPRPNYASLGDFDSSPFQRSLLSDIATLEKQRQQMLLTEIDGSDKVKNTDEQLRVLTDMLRANVESVRNEKKSRLDSAVSEEARVQAKLAEIHQSEVRWSDLERNQHSVEEEYELFRRKYNESAAARTALEQQVDENVVVLEHATDPLQPSGMRKTVALGLAFAAALIAALAYVSIGEFLDQRIYTPGQAERETGAPVLAIVPLSKLKSRADDATGTEGQR